MGDHGFLSYVKRVIHSLVVSTPDRVTIERLKRDYANEEGCPVPYNSLGFKDIESFLRSIPDTVELVGYGPMAYVLAKSNAKTAHIQALVQCQKRPSSKQKNRKRGKPLFCYPSERSDIVFINEYHKSNNVLLNNYNNYNSYRMRYDSNSSANQYVKQPPPTQTSVVRQNNLTKETNSITNSLSKCTIANAGNSSSAAENSLEIYVEKDESPDKLKLPNQSLSKNNRNRSPQYISSDEGCDEDAEPEYSVDKEILNYKYAEVAGCTNLINVESNVQSNWTDHHLDYSSSDEGSESDAIPVFAVDQNVLSVEYPRDAVRFDYQLPKQNVHKKFKLEERVEVQLVTVASPHSFYFWLHDEDYEQYKGMSYSMQQFYSIINEYSYTIPLFLIMVGHLGAVHVREEIWHRVKVLNIKAGDRMNVEVELIDTGDRIWICHTDLKYLCKDFARLPPQCWPGRLACITPRQGKCFSMEASNYFYDIVCYRRLYAKIEKINDADNTCTMILVDPNSSLHTKNINMALIESGWVRRCYKP
ncbi:uncharacterized protein LOC6579697 isoform X1 [Drosophila mojavensis]|uniref:HTH OST-type domain-containing protein n=1 Tax=Drosophila mojavensis TaxID=7230 RepID=B4KSK9_DROMO|nr:uncharacterized protein LOC6579697 isoform X1 [Drosophila mojavensis]EDW09514.2 uncharacterized protein Dmoj_GI18993 [Drosophila mojavensis]